MGRIVVVLIYIYIQQLCWLESTGKSYYFTLFRGHGHGHSSSYPRSIGQLSHQFIYFLLSLSLSLTLTSSLIYCFCSSVSRYSFILLGCTVCRIIKRFATSHNIICIYGTAFFLSLSLLFVLVVWMWKYETPIRHRHTSHGNRVHGVCLWG